jgi:hypothetical protein
MKTKDEFIKMLRNGEIKDFNQYRFHRPFEVIDLSGADLSDADLNGADLNGADLNGADLDLSCLYLSCKSLKFKSDEKQRIQIAFHFASLIKNCENATEEEKEIYKNILPYVNKFHRVDVERLTELK